MGIRAKVIEVPETLDKFIPLQVEININLKVACIRLDYTRRVFYLFQTVSLSYLIRPAGFFFLLQN